MKENVFSKEQLQQLFNHSADIEIKDYRYKKETLLFVYCKPITDSSLIKSLIVPSSTDHNNDSLIFNFLHGETYDKKTIHTGQIEEFVFSGKLLVIPSGNEIYLYDISKPPVRQPDESVAEVSIRGPKDGFVEDININLGLIRKRLRTKSLVVEEYTIGKRSHTQVALLYIKDVINPEILKNIQNKLSSIDLDILNSSSILGEYLYGKNIFTIAPLINFSGRPDFVVSSINQGRFALIIDGAPTALLAPLDLTYMFKTPEDDNTSFYAASLERVLRFMGLLTTTFLPGFYTALTSHHVGQLPLPYIATIALSRLGMPFSPFIEMFVMLIMIELFKEGGARLPKGIGQTVSVLGALIIGDAAIQGGITSPNTLVIIGVTAISDYTLVNQSLAGNIFLLRLFVLIMSYIMGIFGFVLSLFSVLLYFSKLKSFEIPYLSQISSPKPMDIIYTLFRLPFPFMKERNQSLLINDDTRKGE